MTRPFVTIVNALWAAWTRASLAEAGGAMLERVPGGRIRPWLDRSLDAISRWAWWQPALRARLSAGRDRPLVPEAELEATYRDAIALLTADGTDDVGAYLEFGVYVGTSLLCMHRASAAAGLPRMRLVGFDSFEGLPPSASTDDDGAFRPGWYRADHDIVREHLTRNGIDWSRTTLVPGWFDETLRPGAAERLGIDRAAVILIDCDIYSSALSALRFCAPLIRDRAVIVFDDWNAGDLAANGLGERRAFEEFLAEHPGAFETQRIAAPHVNAAVFLVERTAVASHAGPPRGVSARQVS